MGKYLDFVEEISFVRVGGSKEEREVSEKIQREIKEAAKAGGQRRSCRREDALHHTGWES